MNQPDIILLNIFVIAAAVMNITFMLKYYAEKNKNIGLEKEVKILKYRLLNKRLDIEV